MNSLAVYFGLGSNRGDRLARLEEAVSRLDAVFGTPCEAISSVLETEPLGLFQPEDGGAPAPFLNAVCRYRVPEAGQDARLHALWILSQAKAVERAMGRTDQPAFLPDGRRLYHSRNIDIDLLLYGELRMRTPVLTLPHPRMAQREFVMIPLREVAMPETLASFPEIFPENDYFCRTEQIRP